MPGPSSFQTTELERAVASACLLSTCEAVAAYTAESECKISSICTTQNNDSPIILYKGLNTGDRTAQDQSYIGG